MTPQRQIRVALLLPQQLARVTPQRPEQRSEVPEHRHNDHEAQKQGKRHSDHWQLKNDLSSSISAPPRFPAACQRSDPSERAQPCLLAPSQPSGSSEPEPRVMPLPTTRTPPAHKLPASLSWSARRLRQEPFDERSAWKFPPAGSSPHCRRDSALF